MSERWEIDREIYDKGYETGYKKAISTFLDRWRILLKWYNDDGFDYEMHKGNIKNFIIKEIEKLEGKLK